MNVCDKSVMKKRENMEIEEIYTL